MKLCRMAPFFYFHYYSKAGKGAKKHVIPLKKKQEANGYSIITYLSYEMTAFIKKGIYLHLDAIWVMI